MPSAPQHSASYQDNLTMNANHLSKSHQSVAPTSNAVVPCSKPPFIYSDLLSNARYAERHYIWGKRPPSPPNLNDAEMLEGQDSSETIPIDGEVPPSHPLHQPTRTAFLHRQKLVSLQEVSQEGDQAPELLESKELATTTFLTVSGEPLGKAVLHGNKAHITPIDQPKDKPTSPAPVSVRPSHLFFTYSHSYYSCV